MENYGKKQGKDAGAVKKNGLKNFFGFDNLIAGELNKLVKDCEDMDLTPRSKEIIKEMIKDVKDEYKFVHRISFFLIGMIFALLLIYLCFTL